MIKFFVASILIHVTAFILLFGIDVKEKKKEEPREMSVAQPIQVTLLNPSYTGIDTCENFYHGIGIVYHPESGMILDAPENLPAYRAGIRPGDTLVDPNQDRPDDGPMHLKITRNEKTLTFSIPQEPVCYTS